MSELQANYFSSRLFLSFLFIYIFYFVILVSLSNVYYENLNTTDRSIFPLFFESILSLFRSFSTAI